MSFETREDVKRAIQLLESAAGDLRRALDYDVREQFWRDWQEQAQAALLIVSASMDLGRFGLPHPWNLNGWSTGSLAEQYMIQAIEHFEGSKSRSPAPDAGERSELK